MVLTTLASANGGDGGRFGAFKKALFGALATALVGGLVLLAKKSWSAAATGLEQEAYIHRTVPQLEKTVLQHDVAIRELQAQAAPADDVRDLLKELRETTALLKADRARAKRGGRR